MLLCGVLVSSLEILFFFQHRQMYLAFYIQNLLRCLNLMLAITSQKQLSYRVKLLEDCKLFVNKIESFFLRTSDVSKLIFMLKVSLSIEYYEI